MMHAGRSRCRRRSNLTPRRRVTLTAVGDDRRKRPGAGWASLGHRDHFVRRVPIKESVAGRGSLAATRSLMTIYARLDRCSRGRGRISAPCIAAASSASWDPWDSSPRVPDRCQLACRHERLFPTEVGLRKCLVLSVPRNDPVAPDAQISPLSFAHEPSVVDRRDVHPGADDARVLRGRIRVGHAYVPARSRIDDARGVSGSFAACVSLVGAFRDAAAIWCAQGLITRADVPDGPIRRLPS